MLKACKIDATLINNPFSPKYLPGQILATLVLHESWYYVVHTNTGHEPSPETEDERSGVRCGAEVQLSVAYEAFGAEHIRILINLGIARASPWNEGT